MKTVILFLVFVQFLFGHSVLGLNNISGNVATQFNLTESKQIITQANERFTLRLLNHLQNDDETSSNGSNNVFISPFSISVGLAMTMLGAGDQSETYSQMRDALGFENSHSLDQITFGYQQLLLDLNLNQSSVLKMANAIAIQHDRPFLPNFLSQLQENFNSNIFSVDFKDAPQKALDRINQWSSERTNGSIPVIVEKVEPEQVAVLLNAVQFNGKWKVPFPLNDTKNREFFVQNRESKSVPFMQVTGFFGYAELNGTKIVELPYQEQSISMFVFLPKESESNNSSLNLEEFLPSRIIHKMWPKTKLKLLMPKFALEMSYKLKEPLQKMGILDAFKKGRADFSNINAERSIFMSKVLHKSVIEVSEEGTRAAAVTAVEVRWWSPAKRVIPHVELNRPFGFVIRENRSGIVLFAGIINDPEAK